MGVGHISYYKKKKTNITDAGGPEQDFENPLVKGRASRYHAAKSKPQDVPERGENLTGALWHPSGRPWRREGAEGPVSLG